MDSMTSKDTKVSIARVKRPAYVDSGHHTQFCALLRQHGVKGGFSQWLRELERQLVEGGVLVRARTEYQEAEIVRRTED